MTDTSRTPIKRRRALLGSRFSSDANLQLSLNRIEENHETDRMENEPSTSRSNIVTSLPNINSNVNQPTLRHKLKRYIRRTASGNVLHNFPHIPEAASSPNLNYAGYDEPQIVRPRCCGSTETVVMNADFAPMYKNFQLIGDSQFLRFAENFLGCTPLVTTLPGTNTRRLNYCVSGQKMEDLYNSLTKKEFPLYTNAMVLIGTNDIINETDVKLFINIYEQMVNFLKAEIDNIVLITVPPVPKLEHYASVWMRLDQVNSFIKSLCDYDQVYVVDLCSLLERNNFKTCSNYFEKTYFDKKRVDKVHLNKRGFMLLEAVLDIEYFHDDDRSSDGCTS